MKKPCSVLIAAAWLLLAAGSGCTSKPASVRSPPVTVTLRLLTPTPSPDRLAASVAETLAPLGPTSRPTLIIPTAASRKFPENVGARLDALLTDMTTQGLFSGAVLVAQDGEVLLEQGYGLANREDGVLNTPLTKFRIASLTKTFTAVLVLMMQEEGKLDVNDLVCSYITSCPAAWREVTIHHLLTHTSGIPDLVAGLQDWERTLPITPADVITRFADVPLSFTPGSNWLYSNTGYTVLGYILEQVSGQPYEELLRQKILDPLGMANTGHDRSATLLYHRAAGYVGGPGDLRNADYIDMTILYAAGELYSTVEDLYRWDQALYTTDLVSAQALETIFTAYAPVPRTDWEGGYGYGWMVGKYRNRRMMYHNGMVSGFTATIRRWPDDRLTVIILSNMEDAVTPDIGDQLGEMVLGGP